MLRPVKVGGDDVRVEALLDAGQDVAEDEAAAAVADVEEDAALSGFR